MIGIRTTPGVSGGIRLMMTVALLATTAGLRAEDAGGSSDAARSAYESAEWSGGADRRKKSGRKARIKT
jgi:hypothetical protein